MPHMDSVHLFSHELIHVLFKLHGEQLEGAVEWLAHSSTSLEYTFYFYITASNQIEDGGSS